jgi:hypothetical protein
MRMIRPRSSGEGGGGWMAVAVVSFAVMVASPLLGGAVHVESI